ncbi:hypothetical protein Tco_0545463 [Tanacetum coccineum]
MFYCFSYSHPFGDCDFLLNGRSRRFVAALEDDPTSSEVDPTYQDPEGDILLLEAILNSEPPPPLPNQEQYMPEVRKELKLCEAKTVEPFFFFPLMNLPRMNFKDTGNPILEYAFLANGWPTSCLSIIAKGLKR